MTKPKYDTRGTGGRFVRAEEAPRVPARAPLKRGKGMGSYQSMSTPGLNRKKSQHVIDDISFSRDFIVCICAWKGPISEYQPHRKEAEQGVEGATK